MSKPDSKNDWRTFLPIAQVALVLFGLAGAILHAVPVHEGILTWESWPHVDAVDIGWLGLVVVAVLLPGISKLTVGGVSVELKEEARESAEQLEEAIEDYANLVQNWSTASIIYIEQMTKSTDSEQQALLLSNYLRDRMGEAKEYLSEDPTDDVRIALWVYDPEANRLEFFFSNEREPTKQSYSVGEGMVGQAFLERRRFNEPDVRNVPSYLSTRAGEDPPYRAVLCVPVSIGDNPIGMITADKKTADLFSSAADDIAKGLASQCALAIDQFRKAG